MEDIRRGAAVTAEPQSPAPQQSGKNFRPINEIARKAIGSDAAETSLEEYKVSLRRYAPVQKGLAGLPWSGEWRCIKCRENAPGKLLHEPAEDALYLELECQKCGTWRERHHDILFTRSTPSGAHPRQPEQTRSGFPIRPILGEWPKTIETLCPECSCVILGRSFVEDGAVWMEKTCPEHGYFRDKVNSNAKLHALLSQRCFQDETGVENPQVADGANCPTDCGFCNQHHSTPCLSQIDLSNRCNLTCPVCFASANQAGYLSEPSYAMVVEMLTTLRESKPVPVTAIQFTGGEPTMHPDFFRIVRKANEMGFTHVQIASNGILMSDPEFAKKAAEAGLHTMYLQFDGVKDELYQKLRGKPLMDVKKKAVENCRQNDIRICLVPTIVRGVNDDQIEPILKFAVENSDVINAIAYQPVSFTGRIARKELEGKRYTLGDLAEDIAEASGADVERDFYPANLVTPVSRRDVLSVRGGSELLRAVSNPLADAAFLLGVSRLTGGRLEAVVAVALIPFVTHLIVLLLQITVALPLLPGGAGIRAQALARDGTLIDDFIVSETEHAVHVRNAPSPAATSSMPLARLIADRLEQV